MFEAEPRPLRRRPTSYFVGIHREEAVGDLSKSASVRQKFHTRRGR